MRMTPLLLTNTNQTGMRCAQLHSKLQSTPVQHLVHLTFSRLSGFCCCCVSPASSSSSTSLFASLSSSSDAGASEHTFRCHVPMFRMHTTRHKGDIRCCIVNLYIRECVYICTLHAFACLRFFVHDNKHAFGCMYMFCICVCSVQIRNCVYIWRLYTVMYPNRDWDYKTGSSVRIACAYAQAHVDGRLMFMGCLEAAAAAASVSASVFACWCVFRLRFACIRAVLSKRSTHPEDDNTKPPSDQPSTALRQANV